MSEPIKFRSEAEARAWDGYAAAHMAGLIAADAEAGDESIKWVTYSADALLAERRKREGVEERPALSPVNGYAVAMEVMAALIRDVRHQGNTWAGLQMSTALSRAEALVAAARGTK